MVIMSTLTFLFLLCLIGFVLAVCVYLYIMFGMDSS